MEDLVTVDWLAEHLCEDDLVVMDASMAPPGTAPVARPAASIEGIPGAVPFDLDSAMSRHDEADGLGPVGVHDMPAPGDFERELRRIGLRDGDRVVVYDRTGLFSSARAWWMLRNAGIEAAVLDGGLPAWLEAGRPLAPLAEALPSVGDVVVRWNDGAFVDGDATASALASGDAVVLDARGAARFTGEEADPRPGTRAGHMPGARSLPFSELAPGGRVLPVAALRQRLAEAAGDAPIVASCGSGVTAAVVALAARLVGRPVTVYDGSWAEWGREDSGREVAVGA